MNPDHRHPHGSTASGDPATEDGLAAVIRLHPVAAEPPKQTGRGDPGSPADSPSDTAADPPVQGGENFLDGDVALARALRTVPSMIAKTSSPIGFLTRAMPLSATPSLTPATTGEPVAAVVVVDSCWRVHDTAVLTTAGWTTGTRVHFTADATGLLARTATADDPDAVCATIDGRGRLLIPGPLRRALGLRVGQDLLLMADPGTLTPTAPAGTPREQTEAMAQIAAILAANGLTAADLAAATPTTIDVAAYVGRFLPTVSAGSLRAYGT